MGLLREEAQESMEDGSIALVLNNLERMQLKIFLKCNTQINP